MEHVKPELSAFLDGELTQNETRRVESHLQDCADCKAELEELKSLTGKLKNLPEAPLPAGFEHRLKLKRSAPAQASFIIPLGLRPAAFAATGLLVAFIGYKGMQGPMSPEQVAIRSAEKTLDPDGRYLAASQLNADGTSPAPAEEEAPARREARARKVLKSKKKAADKKVLTAARGKMVAVTGAGGSSAGASSALPMPKSSDYYEGTPYGAYSAGPARTNYTNEELHSMLEAEKRASGITFTRQERRAPSALARLHRARAGLHELTRTPRTVPVSGIRTKALAETKLHSFAPGSPVQESNSFDSWPKAPEPESAGILVRSKEEMLQIWKAFSLGSFPPVDFSKNMLIVVLDGRRKGLSAAILSAKESQGRIVVRYRLSAVLSSPSLSPGTEEACSPEPDDFCSADTASPKEGSAASGRYRIIRKTALPVVFQKAL